MSNVEKGSGKPTKMAASEQARRILGKAKDDAGDSADWWRGRPRGFDALGLSDSGRARYRVPFAPQLAQQRS
jgi:hypothetical protein